MKKARCYVIAAVVTGLVCTAELPTASAQVGFRVGNMQFQFGGQRGQGGNRPRGGYYNRPGQNLQGINQSNPWNQRPRAPQLPYQPGQNLYPSTLANNWNSPSRPYYPQGRVTTARPYQPQYSYSRSYQSGSLSSGSSYAGGSSVLRQNTLPSVGSASSPRARIVNPAHSGGDVYYTLNGHSYTIRPGEAQTLSRSIPYIVQFDRGSNSGSARYNIREGLYEFRPTEAGWELYHTEDTL